MSVLNRIKILFIHSTLVCGGAEQALFDLVTLMDKNKFDVTILVQHEGGIWEDKFRAAGIKVVSVWNTQKITINPVIKLQNLLQRLAIKKALSHDGKNLIDASLKEKFDIVISYCVWDHQYIGFQKGAKSIKYIHGDVSTLPAYKDSIKDAAASLSGFDRFICVSENGRKSFMNLTGIHENVVTHFNPINSSHVRALANGPVQARFHQPVICAVGRLAVEKGFDRLIKIHKELLTEGIHHSLIIVGDGAEKEKLEGLIEKLNVSDTVLLAGYQSNPYPYMAHSQFVVCSSYSEGLPVIAMEALCLGIPVVSSVPSIGELFGDESCGIVTQNDDESLKNGIRKMLMDSSFFEKQKEGASKRSACFDGRQMAIEVENEFLSVLNGK